VSALVGKGPDVVVRIYIYSLAMLVGEKQVFVYVSALQLCCFTSIFSSISTSIYIDTDVRVDGNYMP
jgi:hypothetical protein